MVTDFSYTDLLVIAGTQGFGYGLWALLAAIFVMAAVIARRRKYSELTNFCNDLNRVQ